MKDVTPQTFRDGTEEWTGSVRHAIRSLSLLFNGTVLGGPGLRLSELLFKDQYSLGFITGSFFAVWNSLSSILEGHYTRQV